MDTFSGLPGVFGQADETFSELFTHFFKWPTTPNIFYSYFHLVYIGYTFLRLYIVEPALSRISALT
jgi:hypothetical protein